MMNSTISVNNTRLILICIILFTGFLFLFNLGKRDLWAPDEPRYAQVSKEMRDTGNFIVPHLNSAPYPDKPPLLFWLINLFSLPFGKITALSARLPSAFAGIGCCVAIFYLGKYLYQNTRLALLSSLLLATSSKFLWMAHRVAFDVLLTFFVTMAIVCFYKGYSKQKNNKKYYILFYISMALGVLTKGPIGFILPFLTILIYLLLKKDLKVLKETRPWLGGLIFVLIVFTWVYLASVYSGREYAYQILFKQNVDRFASSFAHERPFYYYFINFPINYFPWTVFIPSVVIYLLSKEGREKIRNILLPLIWFAVVFVFFSFSSGKRDIYVLPLYPASSMIMAWFLNEFIERFREDKFKKIGYYPCFALTGIATVLTIVFPVIIYKNFPEYIVSTIPFVICLCSGSIAMFRFIKHSRIIPFLFTVIFVIFFAFNLGTIRAIPLLNQHKSAREICDKAKSIIKPDEKLAMFNFFSDHYLFYTNRNYVEVIHAFDALKQYLNSNERVFLFIQEKDFKEISKFQELPLFVLAKNSVGHRDILFVSNKDI